MNTFIKLISLSFLMLFCNLPTAAELTNLDPEQLISMQQNNALIIDIRTVKEWQETGIITNSHKIEFFNAQGKYDTDAWLKQVKSLRQSPEQPIILVCRSGNRSNKVGTFLAKQLGMTNIYHLQNGMSSWLKTGHKTDQDCPTQLACNKQ